MKTKLVLVSCLLISLVLASSFFELSMAGDKEDSCHEKCVERCSKEEKEHKCLKYCKKCCKKCGCVPSGTYDHKDECPCYHDKKTSMGKPKCL